MTARRRWAAALVGAALLAGGVAFVAACDEGEAGGGNFVPAKLGPQRRYVFELEGGETRWPYTHRMYLRVNKRGAFGAWQGVAIDSQGRFAVEEREGAQWELLSEDEPTTAERTYFWMIDASGTFGAQTQVSVPTPQRTTVVVRAPKVVAGREWLSFHRPGSPGYGTVINDLHSGLYERAFVPGRPQDCYLRRAEARPLHFTGFASGRYQLAVRVDGRQWLTRDVTLEPGGTLELDAWGQPPGGGTVVVEEASSILLLGGTFPVAAPRTRVDIVYRETWEGVPPGTHKVRYVDGEEVSIEVRDGEKTRVRKRPR